MMNLRSSSTILLTLLFFCSVVAFGQIIEVDSCYAPVDSLTKKPTFLVVESPAEVEGGTEALHRMVVKRLKVPSSVKRQNIDIKIVVAFVVDENGLVTGKRIIRNIDGSDLAEQVLKVISDFKWTPGKCKGKAVPTLHIYPLNICFG